MTTTENAITVGSYVRKGNGRTVYRVWAVSETHASVVKATTATTPTRGCWYALDSFVLVEKPADAAEVTGPRRSTSSPAPAVVGVTIEEYNAARITKQAENLAWLVSRRGQTEHAEALEASIAQAEAKLAELTA